MPLELGGKRTKRIAVSEATVRTGDAELSAAIAQVRNDVRRAYYEVLVADARAKVLRELRDLAHRARDTAQARFDSGDAPRLEVVQADLALAAAENEATAARRQRESPRGRGSMRCSGSRSMPSQPLSTAPSMPAVPSSPATASSSRAPGARSSLVLDRRIEEQRAKVALAQALRVPDITPSATLTHDAEPEFTYGWRAGVAITLPVFTTHKAGVLVEQTTLEQLMR